KTGPFPTAEFALLKKAEPLVASLVRHFWPGLGARCDAQRDAGMRTGRKRGVAAQALQPAETVWRDLKLTSRETAIV
ncbi:helix-turn-helix transcriptional regulator, partial [Rhizobium ruizarguesonis]